MQVGTQQTKPLLLFTCSASALAPCISHMHHKKIKRTLLDVVKHPVSNKMLLGHYASRTWREWPSLYLSNCHPALFGYQIFKAVYRFVKYSFHFVLPHTPCSQFKPLIFCMTQLHVLKGLRPLELGRNAYLKAAVVHCLGAAEFLGRVIRNGSLQDVAVLRLSSQCTDQDRLMHSLPPTVNSLFSILWLQIVPSEISSNPPPPPPLKPSKVIGHRLW